MAERSEEAAPAGELTHEIAELGRRLSALQAEGDRDVLLQELESAHEELRVADDEVRAQQEELREALRGRRADRRRHDRLISVVPVPVLVTDVRGVVRTANPAAAALLNMRPDSLVGKPLPVLVEDSDRSELRHELSGLTAPGAQGFRRVVALRPRDRNPFPAELVATVVGDEHDAVNGVTFLVLSVGQPGSADTVDVHRLAAAFGNLTRLPLNGGDQAEVLTEVAGICERAAGPGSAVSVTIGDPAAPLLLASTSQLAQLVDGKQVQTGEGPCVSAWETRELVWSTDLHTDERWPKLAELLDGVPVQGAIAAPVSSGHGTDGALNVYLTAGADLAHAIPEWVDLLAGAVAAVLQEIELKHELEEVGRQLNEALRSRATIDQAKGMLMAVQGCNEDEAFALLVKLSSEKNVKVRDIAARLVAGVSAGHPLRATRHVHTRQP